jgi:hypothetical protein
MAAPLSAYDMYLNPLVFEILLKADLSITLSRVCFLSRRI